MKKKKNKVFVRNLTHRYIYWYVYTWIFSLEFYFKIWHKVVAIKNCTGFYILIHIYCYWFIIIILSTKKEFILSMHDEVGIKRSFNFEKDKYQAVGSLRRSTRQLLDDEFRAFYARWTWGLARGYKKTAQGCAQQTDFR